jgi:ABC-type transport system involved in multi-copper enzyme maturation permease subunit
MINLIRAEMLKLRKTSGYWVLLLSAMLLGIFLGVFFLTDDRRIGGLDGFNESMDAVQADIIFLSLFAAFFISSEFTNRTIGAGIVGGHTRRRILLSKTLVSFLGSLPILFVIPVFITAVTTIVNGFGTPLNAEVIAYLVRTSVLYLLGGIAMSGCCVLIAVIIRNIGGTIGVGIGALIGLFYLTGIKPLAPVSKFIFIWHLNNITTLNGTGSVLFSGVVLIANILITVFISLTVFAKSDLK